jgi:hypothetical protein
MLVLVLLLVLVVLVLLKGFILASRTVNTRNRNPWTFIP